MSDDPAQLLVQVLRLRGDTLTRENVMNQAANLNLELPMLLPGIRITTSRTDFEPIKQISFAQFNGRFWVSSGEVIGG
jgi:hypothetical protein